MDTDSGYQKEGGGGGGGGGIGGVTGPFCTSKRKETLTLKIGNGFSCNTSCAHKASENKTVRRTKDFFKD